MSNQYYKIWSLAGTKLAYLDILLPLIHKSKAKRYIEPFLGMSVIYLNTKDIFEEYIVNDLNMDMVMPYKEEIYKHRDEFLPLYNKLITPEMLKWKYTKDGWGDWKNSHLYNSTGMERMVYFTFLASRCIMGQLKWTGKNQFSCYAGAGLGSDRYRFYGEDIVKSLEIIEQRRGKTKVFCNTCQHILDNYVDNNEDNLIILDPPYSDCHWSTSSDNLIYYLHRFMDEHNKCKFIFFDYIPDISVLKEFIKKGFNYKIIDKNKNTMIHKEILVWNF